MSAPLAEQIISRNESLKSKASNWRTTWQDIANYIMPRKGQIMQQTAPGQDQTSQLFDTTAEESNLIFAAGLLSQLVPPGEIWARFESANKKASEAEKAWWDEVTTRAMEAIYGSNFYLAIHEDFLDAGGFCTSGTYCEEGSKRFFLNFVNMPVGSFHIAEDNEGMVDTVYREWKWTARQAEQQWGREKLQGCVTLMKALLSTTAADADKEFTFIHAVYPRLKGDFKDGKVEGKLRPIASCYVCVEDKYLIDEGGYYEMAHAVSRLMRSNNEVYGRGPGTSILPEVKTVNRMEYDLLLAYEKEVNPGWLMPEDAAYRPDNRPGGVTYWDVSNPSNKPEVLQRQSRLDLGEQKTEQKRERIRRAFFVDMFQMLNRPEVLKTEKTAFEVAQLVQEKLLLFAPFFARITQEKLSILLERVFNIMLREGKFDEPPIEMSGEYKIVYTSKIALAIKAAQDNAVLDMLQLCSLMAPFDQSVPMVMKWRESFRASARNRGVPASLMRSDEEIDGMMEQMQKAQQAMQAAELAEKAAGAVNKLGPDAQKAAAGALGKSAT